MTFDETYRNVQNVFGEEPELVLKSHYQKMNKSLPVLDIGVGQGSNTFFLAREGFQVDTPDPSKVAVKTVSAIAEKEVLNIRAYQSGFDEFIPSVDCYSGILVFGLIQILPWKSIELLLEKIKRWINEGSLVFATGFAVTDPSFEKYSITRKMIGKNSFADEQGNIRTYLEAGEILNLFDGYKVIHHREGMGPEHSHGNGLLERHAMVEVVLQR